MIRNASILRITHANPANAGGEVSWTPAAEAIVGLRCSQTTPTRRQQFMLGAVIKDATAVVRVLASDLTRLGLSIDTNDQVETKVDGEAGSETFRVLHVTKTTKGGGLSNVAAFLQKA